MKIKLLLTMIILSCFSFAFSQDFSGASVPYNVWITIGMNGYHYNNADFLSYDKDSYEEDRVYDAINTDDQLNFFLSTIQFDINKKFGKTEVDISVDRSGFWGNDTLMGRDNGDNAFRFLSLHMIARPVSFYELKVGRFDYEIGDAANDYFFNDIIDGVEQTFSLPLGPDTLNLSLLTEVMSNAAKPSDTYAWSAIEKDGVESEDFDGDTVSLRGGAVLRYFAASAFAYYVRYGGNTEGAADKSDDGNTAVNEADHDYLMLGGTRFFYKVGNFLSTDATLAYSSGKDYQYSEEKEYKGLGAALNVVLDASKDGLNLPILDEAYISGGYFEPKYCGMKGSSPGGMLMHLYQGYFVSQYANFYHFKDYARADDEVSAYDKTVSKVFGKIGFSIVLGDFSAELMNVIYFANEDKDIDYSNSAGETFKGEDGPTLMGTEHELGLSYQIDEMEIFLNTAVFRPTDYYKKRSSANTYFTEGEDLFYGVNLGCSYEFGI